MTGRTVYAPELALAALAIYGLIVTAFGVLYVLDDPVEASP